MGLNNDIASDLANQYNGLIGKLPGAELHWVQKLRENSITAFKEIGLPTVHNESWKYTNINKIRHVNFLPASFIPPQAEIQLPAYDMLDICAYKIVLINGSLVKSLSDIGEMPDGIALKSINSITENSLSQLIEFKRTPMAALNTAAFSDFLYFDILEGTQIDKPIHLISVALAETAPVMFHPRFTINAGPNSKATFLESHIGLGAEAYLSNSVSEIELGANATLHHYKIQNEYKGATHVAASEVRIAEKAAYENFVVTTGAKISRNEIHSKIIGSDADCRLMGTYLLSEKQHGDHTTLIEHAAPDSTSNEIYKGVLADCARGVFQGKILVEKGSQRTVSHQLNQALLLSNGTEIDSKPELEIYADDVKCSHGASAGELDEEALFYLRARGINEVNARNILIEAFMKSVLDEVSEPSIQDILNNNISNWLVAGESYE